LIHTKRWNDPPERADGFRLLICRYRPRGVPKADEPWDAWDPALAPSRGLLADFHGKERDPISWDEYRVRYLEEMKAQDFRLRALANRDAAGETITLLCSSACVDETHCHRTLLRELILARGASK
jgi:uncharacterized protein YeaO (DUF488 family)